MSASATNSCPASNDLPAKRQIGVAVVAAEVGVSSRPRLRCGPALLLGVAILLWGANWPVMKVGLGHVSPLWFSASRFAMGAACLFVWQMLRRELRLPERADLPIVASIGLLQMMLFTALGAVAMTHLPAGRSAILSYTTPIWVLPAALLLFGERIERRRWVGIIFAGLGVLLLLNPHAIDWRDAQVVGANAMLLAASAAWALCILHLRYGRAPSPAIRLAPWQMLLAAMVLAPLARAVEGPFTGDGTGTLWVCLAFVGPVATAFCFCAVNAASARLPASAMSTLMLAVPVSGLAFSMAALRESPGPDLILGAAAIVLGVAASARS
ncbi:DMT(drug/metabolite transporter) superfamily permease [Methylobacterium variabile]|uniref:DMT(Drug/metabolite transporter) superfamily permease n=1 Tax=Methylobacterium variabile TaxID=298794 RepID=A0A0J6S367_9HYPH|nr:DMT family transporter [Methylobacterium variabile]KMO27963.1 DMT(drug/metabolite transporter) superfamily permease [Methylobacterium variabile]